MDESIDQWIAKQAERKYMVFEGDIYDNYEAIQAWYDGFDNVVHTDGERFRGTAYRPGRYLCSKPLIIRQHGMAMIGNLDGSVELIFRGEFPRPLLINTAAARSVVRES